MKEKSEYHQRLRNWIDEQGGIVLVAEKVGIPHQTIRMMLSRGTFMNNASVSAFEQAFPLYDDYYIRTGVPRLQNLYAEIEKLKSELIHQREESNEAIVKIVKLIPDAKKEPVNFHKANEEARIIDMYFDGIDYYSVVRPRIGFKTAWMQEEESNDASLVKEAM